MEQIMQYAAIIITAIGIITFIVSLVTQVIKEIGFLSKIPTNLVVIVLSLAFTMVAVLMYGNLKGITLTWPIYVGAVVAGFIVAFVAMFGWEKFYELWERFKGRKIDKQ